MGLIIGKKKKESRDKNTRQPAPQQQPPAPQIPPSVKQFLEPPNRDSEEETDVDADNSNSPDEEDGLCVFPYEMNSDDEHAYEVPIDGFMQADDNGDGDDEENEEHADEQTDDEEENEEETINWSDWDNDETDDEEDEEETFIPTNKLIGQILNGDLNIEIPSQVRIVRIFTSSTFTDTFHERNILMVKVYPKLKEYCQSYGFDFQVVDMRWGVRDEATAYHMTTELCMKELKACQQLSTGPNFITFLGQKYGYRPFPPKIAYCEFEAMFHVITNQADKDLVRKWFLKDDNTIPPTYLLQPINEILPNYNNQLVSKEERSEASNQWWNAFERMQTILRKAASKSCKKDKAKAWKYYMSVTEDEVTRGILNAKAPLKHTHWFKRNINDIKDYVENKWNTRNFIDKQGSLLNKEANEFCQRLREKKLPNILKAENISVYDVRWHGDAGIEPESCKQHQSYLDILCKDFYRTLTKMIDQGIEERKSLNVDDSLIKEICQHASTCIEKSRIFRGREDILEKIASYITDEENKTTRPLIIYGQSGCGKTSIMAKAALDAKLLHTDRIQITRFLGTTSDSSTISKLLYSIVCQIKNASHQSSENVPTVTKELIKYMQNLFDDMENNEGWQKVVFFLDSIDQLSPDDGAFAMKWLPKELPSSVKIIISTLPEEKYLILPHLKGALPENQFIKVPLLTENVAADILSAWLAEESKQLPDHQRKVVLDAFEQCPLPLFLKLCFDEAMRWKSYTDPKDIVLQANIKDAINTLFSRLERLHGKELVSHALGLITASKHGLSDAEIDEILSIDDDVLNDVYQYWTPPVRRIPPLLWVRIRSDLGSYVVSRGANGTAVNMWYHRQFIETATERYLSLEAKLKYHVLLSEYFLGLWSNGKLKPFTTKNGETDEQNRLVAGQPTVYIKQDGSEGVFNYRKLSELPRHLIASGNLSNLKDDVVYNFKFLLAKLKAFGYLYLIEDLAEAAETFPHDQDIKTIHEFLKMSAVVLLRNAEQLPSQIVGRLLDLKSNLYVNKLINDAKSANLPCLYPSIRCFEAPGGPVLHTLAGHTLLVNHANITKDKKHVLSVSNDLSLRVWDTANGLQIRCLDIEACPTMVFPILNDECAIVTSYSTVMTLNLRTEEIYYNNYHAVGYGTSADLSKDEFYFITLNHEGITVFDCRDKNLTVLHAIEQPPSGSGEMVDILVAGQDNYAYTRGQKRVFWRRTITNKNDVREIIPPHDIIFFIFNEDGSKFLLLACASPSTEAYKQVNLYIYDAVTWEIILTFESKYLHTIVHVTNVSLAGNELIWPAMMQVNFWNFQTGLERVALKQGYQGAQYKHAFCPDENTMIVLSMDQNNNSMQIYNRNAIEFEEISDDHREKTDIEKAQAYVGKGEREMFLHPTQPIGVSIPSMDPLLHIWDTSKSRLIKTIKTKDVYATSLKLIDDQYMVIWDHSKKSVLTLDYKENRFIAATPQGTTCDYPPSLYNNTWTICKQTQEILLYDPERKFFKLYDWKTGKETGEIKTEWEKQSQHILTNRDGSIILSCEYDVSDWSKSPPMYIFDTVSRSVIGRFQTKERIDLRPEVAVVSEDARYFVCTENSQAVLVWDIESCSLVKEIKYDFSEYVQGTINALTVNVKNNCLIVNYSGSVPNVNNDYVLTSLLVFYDLTTWEIMIEYKCRSMVNRFDFSGDNMKLMTNSPTAGDGNDRALKLYDLSKVESEKKLIQIGSFMPENDMRFSYLSKDGSALCVGFANVSAVTFFKPCGVNSVDNADDDGDNLKEEPVEIEVDCPFYPYQTTLA